MTKPQRLTVFDRLLLVAVLALIASLIVNTAQAQIDQSVRRFYIGEYWENADSIKIKKLVTQVVPVSNGSRSVMTTPPDTARLYVPSDPSKRYRAVVIWQELIPPPQYDTVPAETVDDRAAGRWTRSNMQDGAKPGLIDNTFAYVVNTSLSSFAWIQATGCKYEFWGERFAGHGQVEIWIDNAKVVTLPRGTGDLRTDFVIGKPSYTVRVPQGLHKFELRTTAGNQYIIDAVKVYTLQPR